ncbi:hypothetical protein ABT147_11995 [Streptomyces sp. NPDC001868]|uniref:hypothetical protein n=1 Tax=Streptomyces sp. NPDC001868 TaxID=3154401 RepID=UPI003331FB56
MKIPVSPDGDVGQIHTATRLIAPGIGCMWCNGLIDPTELAIETHPDTEREHARYIPGVPAPSVMPLNTLAAGEAMTQFLLAVIHRPRVRERHLQDPRQNGGCRWCTPTGNLGRGTSGELSVWQAVSSRS